MPVAYVGSKTIGAACISIGLAVPALSSTLSDLLSRIAGLQAQINANLAAIAVPMDPLQLAAALAAAAADIATQIPQIVASVPLSSIEANVTLSSDLASLLAFKTLLESAVTTLTAAASAGGLHVLSVDSTPAAVGGELAGVVSTGMPGGGLPTARIQGAILVTESPATFAALSSVLLTG